MAVELGTEPGKAAGVTLADDPKIFRADLRRWFADNPPPQLHRADDAFDRDLDDEWAAGERRWQRRLANAGLAGLAWPTEFGGRGATPRQQLVFHEELQGAGGSPPLLMFVGLSHAGPTLIGHGTNEQRARFLPAVLRGDIVFCQLFSEPGAGSDLAAITTSAVRDGDDLVVTGEKRWSTFAQYADRAELLVRTDAGSRHGGLTFALLDMRTPGVSIRPIRTLGGAAEFCEVFLDEVRIPAGDVVGPIGGGWQVATTTLAYERSTAFAPHILLMERTIADLAHRVAEDPVNSSEVARLAIRVAGLRALLDQTVTEQEHSEPGPAASAMKLLASELNFEICKFAATRLGTNLLAYLHSFGLRIGGGTSEVQRNILAERMLGLPREPKPT